MPFFIKKILSSGIQSLSPKSWDNISKLFPGIRNYSNLDNQLGNYVFEFKVYQQKKDPLGNIVKKIETKDKRTSHWVPEIQI